LQVRVALEVPQARIETVTTVYKDLAPRLDLLLEQFRLVAVVVAVVRQMVYQTVSRVQLVQLMVETGLQQDPVAAHLTITKLTIPGVPELLRVQHLMETFYPLKSATEVVILTKAEQVLLVQVRLVVDPEEMQTSILLELD
jgi:hypothetical protein